MTMRSHLEAAQNESAGRRAVTHAASVAWQPRLRAHRMVSRPEYLYIAAMRAVVRFCRNESVVNPEYWVCSASVFPGVQGLPLENRRTTSRVTGRCPPIAASACRRSTMRGQRHSAVQAGGCGLGSRLGGPLTS